jgi:hypothetical protein
MQQLHLRTIRLNLQARREDAVADTIASVQRFTEMTVSLVVTTSFLVVGILSSRIISLALNHLFRAQKDVDSISTSGTVLMQRSTADVQGLVQEGISRGKQLRLKVTITIVFIFTTVLLRASVSIFYAVAQAFQDNNNSCSNSNCNHCRNVFSNIQGWILYTPE